MILSGQMITLRCLIDDYENLCHGQGGWSCKGDHGPGRLRDEEESRRLPATGIDTMKIRVQSVAMHTCAYVSTVQYESWEQ